MPILFDIPRNSDQYTDDVTTFGPLMGLGHGSAYTQVCLRGNIPFTIDGDGKGNVTPHHRIQGSLCTAIALCGEGTGRVQGHVAFKATVPLTLCLRGEGELQTISSPLVGASTAVDYGLTFGVCADISTLTPVRTYCNDLTVLAPTLSNHLPELEGYLNACPNPYHDGMPGDGIRVYNTSPDEAPPPSVWANLNGVELRILQEAPLTGSPYGYHHVWLLADLWFRGKQVMYLRNGDGAQSPSRHILDRGVLNSLIVYLSQVLGMPRKVYMDSGTAINGATGAAINNDIAMVRQWGSVYTHGWR